MTSRSGVEKRADDVVRVDHENRESAYHAETFENRGILVEVDVYILGLHGPGLLWL
jgi:hypothetical protein